MNWEVNKTKQVSAVREKSFHASFAQTSHQEVEKEGYLKPELLLGFENSGTVGPAPRGVCGVSCQDTERLPLSLSGA